jgi:hypothetical protein
VSDPLVEAASAGGTKVLGLLADPGAPAELARKVANDLVEVSADHNGRAAQWEVRTHVRRLPALTEGYDGLVQVAQHCIEEERWHGVVCFTDSPLRDGPHALVADLLRESRVAVLSLPAFGALPLRRHVGAVAAELTQELTEPPDRHESKEGEQRQQGAATRTGRFSRVESPDPEVTVRIMASRAPLRLLVGLVRANQPWRLLGGLKGAMAAALATSAYVLINSSTWQFADQISPFKLSLMMLFSIAGMVMWLVVDHALWEIPSRGWERRRVRLFNASTVATLIIGIGCAFAVLYACNLLAEVFLIDPGFLQTTLGHAVTIADYLSIAWFATSVALLAGAVGSGFEDEESVRKAAYSQRERDRQRQTNDDAEDDGGDAGDGGKTQGADA